MILVWLTEKKSQGWKTAGRWKPKYSTCKHCIYHCTLRSIFFYKQIDYRIITNIRGTSKNKIKFRKFVFSLAAYSYFIVYSSNNIFCLLFLHNTNDNFYFHIMLIPELILCSTSSIKFITFSLRLVSKLR